MEENGAPARELIDRLAEEFVARYRRGERPVVSEYAERYPQLASDIRELFPALVMVEELGPGPSSGAAGSPAAPPGGAPLRQLGDYLILRLVGRGGMGVVYEAEQVSLRRRAALKVLPQRAFQDERQLERFRREARAAASLHHTNIVPVFGVGEEDGVHYYAMQFIRGQGLDQVMRELRRLRRERKSAPHGPPRSAPRGPATGGSGREAGGSGPAGLEGGDGAAPPAEPPPPAEGSSDLTSQIDSVHHYFRSVARIGLQVAEALGYAHAKGILHRDIKPSNLLLEASGTVWVTDFGLAKADDADQLTHSGDVVGTVAYMAPERFVGRSDPRSDIYSLGLTIYELLTMRPVFADTNRQRLLRRVVEETPPAPRSIEPRIPRDLETIVLKAIEKDPGRRYDSAAQVAEDLRCFLAGRPIRARRTSAAERLWLWCQRNPATALLTATTGLLLVVIALGASLAAWKLREERNAALGHLRESTLARARAGRLSGRAGRRFEGLEAISSVASSSLVPAERLELRNEALACMTLTDLRLGARWPREHLQAMAFDQDLTRCAEAEAAAAAGPLQVVEATSGKLRASLVLPAGVFEVAWHPGGELLAAAGANGHTYLWDVTSSRPPADLEGHRAEVVHAAFSRAGDLLVTASWDGTSRLWSTWSGLQLALQEGSALEFGPGDSHLGILLSGVEAGLCDVAPGLGFRVAPAGKEPGEGAGPTGASREGSLLATVSSGGVGLWDLTSLEEIGFLPLREARAADLAGGRLVTVSAEGLLGWRVDPRDGSVEGPELLAGRGASRTPGLALSRDGRSVAFVCGRKEILVRQEEGALPRLLLREHSDAGSLAFSPDGRWLASGTWQGTAVKIWDAGAGRLERTLAVSGSARAAFSPDGRWLLTSSSEEYAAWDVPSWKARWRLRRESPTGIPGCVAFSPTGSMLAVAGSRTSVRLVDPRDGTEIATLETPHDAGIAWFLFGPGGRRLVAGGGARWIQAWDLGELGAALAAWGLEWREPPSSAPEGPLPDAGRGLGAPAGSGSAGADLPGLAAALQAMVTNLRAGRAGGQAGAAAASGGLAMREVLVPEGAGWRFLRGRGEPSEGLAWTQPGFDDSGWEEGRSGFGYGDLDDATILDDMRGSYTTVYLRHAFTVADPGRFRALALSLRVDDGCAAYLNGIEVGRVKAGVPGSRLAFDATAEAAAAEPLAIQEIPVDLALLARGVNVLALQGLNHRLDSSDLSLLPVLLGEP